MKKGILTGILALISTAFFGQELMQDQVPSPVVKSFQQKFKKAADVEWELSGSLYKVDFETGILGTSHEAWYDKTGKLQKHKEEISKSDLSKPVIAKINTEFKSYRVDDVKRITEGKSTTYVVELKHQSDERKITFDANGKVLANLAD